MRLIDADAFKEYLRKGTEGNADIIPQRLVDVVLDIMDGIMLDIDEQPTVDAVPQWIPCEERLPKDLEVVNITWINLRPITYYTDIKDKPFTATAIHYRDKWWWYSPICEDLLAECGKSECDKMDADIEVTAWMPLPEPYEGERKDDDIR